jgi:hypothetical protein
VLDARDVLENARGLLTKLCERVGVPFDDAMLAWPPGRRETDGIWAKDWYHEVEQSTSFRPYRPKPERVPPQFEDLHRRCAEVYEQLWTHRLQA